MFHNTFTCPPYLRNGKPRFVNNVTDQFRLNSDKQSQSDIILLCHADIIFFSNMQEFCVSLHYRQKLAILQHASRSRPSHFDFIHLVLELLHENLTQMIARDTNVGVLLAVQATQTLCSGKTYAWLDFLFNLEQKLWYRGCF